jgi:hypothetical protein
VSTLLTFPMGVGQERETTTVQSEKCVARCDSKYDEMRMITVCFVRVLQRCTGSQYLHFLLIFQEVSPVSKTCNQLNDKRRVGEVRTVELGTRILFIEERDHIRIYHERHSSRLLGDGTSRHARTAQMMSSAVSRWRHRHQGGHQRSWRGTYPVPPPRHPCPG